MGETLSGCELRNRPPTVPTSPTSALGPWWKPYIAPAVIILVVLGAAGRFEYRIEALDGRLRPTETGLAEMRGSLDRYRADALGLESPQIERVSLRPNVTFRATVSDAVERIRYDLTYTIVDIGPDSINFRIDGRVGNAVIENVGVRVPLRPGTITPIRVQGQPTLVIAILDKSPNEAVVAVGPLKEEKAA